MKDLGVIQGSGAQAVPLIIGKDTVYVHTNITQIPDDDNGTDRWEYHEVQYDKDEYIQLMAVQTAEMESLMNTILGVN